MAKWIRKRYFSVGAPANFVAVLMDYPIQVDFRDWPPDLSGIFVRGERISSIGINRNDSRGRRHFTLWHEFYHYLAHEDQLNFHCGPWEHRQRERDCDVFAANVLMPAEWLSDLNGPLWISARKFGVSVQALTLRLDELKKRRTP